MSAPTKARGRSMRASRLALLAGAAIVAPDVRAGDPLIEANWLDAVSGSWSDALRWSGGITPQNGTPSAGDRYRATLGATGAAYTVTLDAPVTLDELVIDSDDVTLDQTSLLTLGRGELRRGRHVLRAALAISDSYEVYSDLTINGGVVTGLGEIVVQQSGMMDIQTDSVFQTAITSSGLIRTASGLSFFGRAVSNSGPGVFESGGAAQTMTSIGVPTFFNNAGLFVRSEPGVTEFFAPQLLSSTAVRMNNSGVVRADDGLIKIFGGGQSSGVFEANGDGRILFEQSHTFSSGARFLGDGAVDLGPGSFVFNGDLQIEGDSAWEGAEIRQTGQGGVLVTGSLALSDTGFVNQGGSFRTWIAETGSVVASNAYLGETVNDGLLRLEGFVAGQISNSATGVVEITGLAGSFASLRNDGLLRLPLGSALGSIRIEESNGPIDVQSGRLVLMGSGDIGLNGEVTVADGATLSFVNVSSGNVSINSDFTLGPQSVLELEHSNVTLGGAFDPQGLIRLISSSNLTLPDGDFVISHLENSFGAITVPGELALDDVAMDGGRFAGAGIVRSGSVEGWDLTQALRVSSGFSNTGVMRFTSQGALIVDAEMSPSPGVFTNEPSGELSFGEGRIARAVDGGVLLNKGLLAIDGDDVEISGLTNEGEVRIRSGSLLLIECPSLGGQILVPDGHGLVIEDSTIAATGVLSGAGSIEFQGTNTIRGQLDGSGDLTFGRGLAVFEQDNTIDSAVTIFQGTIGGDGLLTLNGEVNLRDAEFAGNVVFGPGASVGFVEDRPISVTDGRLEIQGDVALPGFRPITIEGGELVIAEGATLSSATAGSTNIFGAGDGVLTNFGSILFNGDSSGIEPMVHNYGSIVFALANNFTMNRGLNDGLIQSGGRDLTLIGATLTPNSDIRGFEELKLRNEASVVDGMFTPMLEFEDFDTGSTILAEIKASEVNLVGTRVDGRVQGVVSMGLSGGVQINGEVVSDGALAVVGDLAVDGELNSAGPASITGSAIRGNGSIFFSGPTLQTFGEVEFDTGAVEIAPTQFRLESGALRITQDTSVKVRSTSAIIAADGFGGLQNEGVIEFTGVGTSQPNLLLDIDNAGTIAVTDSATLVLRGGQIAQVVGDTLAGGAWEIRSGARLVLQTFDFQTNAAEIRLSGEGSRFDQLGGIRASTGSLSLSDGAGLQITPDTSVFGNSGLLSLDESSSLAINGALEALTGSVIMYELASQVRADRGEDPSAIVSASGAITLGGALGVTHTLIDAPVFGDRYLLFQSVSGIAGEFDSIVLDPLPGGLSWVYERSSDQIWVRVIPAPGSGAVVLLAGLMPGVRRRR